MIAYHFIQYFLNRLLLASKFVGNYSILDKQLNNLHTFYDNIFKSISPEFIVLSKTIRGIQTNISKTISFNYSKTFCNLFELLAFNMNKYWKPLYICVMKAFINIMILKNMHYSTKYAIQKPNLLKGYLKSKQIT